MNIEIIQLTSTAVIPKYQSNGAAALDLYADESIFLKPGRHEIISTGIAIHLNDKYSVCKIYPRSGLGFKHGIVLRNGTGIIDSDYQGEIKVCLVNNGDTAYTINFGDRIAQMVIQPICRVDFGLVTEFTNTTDRGVDGFGSTGE